MHPSSMQFLVTKLPPFVFEALGSLAGGDYGKCVLFVRRHRHGSGELGNQCAVPSTGFLIPVAEWQGGRFAQFRGGFSAIYVGLSCLAERWLQFNRRTVIPSGSP